MKSRFKRGLVAAATAAGAAAALAIGTAGNSPAAPAAAGPAASTTPVLQAVGITADGLTMAAFKTNSPGVLDWVQDIQGLPAGAIAVGIDWRVQNNTLYLLDSQSNIYTVAVPANATQPVHAVRVSKLAVPLYGTFFDIDFNPAADRLRVISDNGQNLRHNLNDHTTIEDSTLNNGGSPARGVTAAGYTNNDLNPDTATTLFDLDTTTDQVVIQSPPNNGSLVATGKLTADMGPNVGLDVFADLVGGKTVENFAFATLQPVGNLFGLYTVNLLTGTATLVANFPRLVQLSDLALPIDTM